MVHVAFDRLKLQLLPLIQEVISQVPGVRLLKIKPISSAYYRYLSNNRLSVSLVEIITLIKYVLSKQRLFDLNLIFYPKKTKKNACMAFRKSTN